MTDLTTLTTMTEKELLCYAYYAILEKWDKEYDRVQEHPNNPYTKARFELTDSRLNEIRDLIIKVETAEKYN